MRYVFAAAVVLGMAAEPAIAGPVDSYIQPAVFARIAFGGKAPMSDLRLGFRAEYSDRVVGWLNRGQRPISVAENRDLTPAKLPALFQAEWSATQIVVSENGLPIAGRSLTLNEAGEQHSGGSNWGLNVGLALAATGAALALIVNSAGHAAKENQQSVNAGPSGVSAGGDNGSNSGSNPCDLQVGDTCVNGH